MATDVGVIVGNAADPNTAEDALIANLRGKGFNVTVADDNAAQTSFADGKELLVISKTVTSTTVGTKFNNVTAGVLFWEDNLQDELAGVRGTQSHYTNDVFDIDPDAGSHPLAAGFATQDNFGFYNREIGGVTDLSWGEPSRANYVVVAANEKGSHDAHIYGIDKGARMDDGRTAPGRRVFFGLYDNSFHYLTANGLKLWDSAVSWASQAVTQPPEPPLPPGDNTGERPQRPASVGGILTITAGGTYTGNWSGVIIKTSQPVLLQNINLVGKGDLIDSRVAGARITLRNVNGWGVNPNVYDKPVGRFLYAFDLALLDAEGCYLESTRGFVVNGNRKAPEIRLVRNWGWNIEGRRSNGNGGWIGGTVHTRAQFINLDKVQNAPKVEIAWNRVINEPYRSRVEDNIALYQSSGTSSSWIKIHDNYIQGAYNADPANDKSFAGGGILLGDGHTGSGYAEAYNNVVVSTTNYGIAISGGHHQRIYNNRVISSGLLPDGRKIAAQNVGIYIWDYHRAGSGFNNNSGSGNLVGWMRTHSNGAFPVGRADWWVPDASSWTNNVHWSPNPTLAMEANEYALWLSR
jgi:hypothetical protein